MTYQPSIDRDGHLISEPCHAGSVLAAFESRRIQPDSIHAVKAGELRLWFVSNLYAAQIITPDGWRLGSPVLYINTTSPEYIAADVMAYANRIASPDERNALSRALDAFGTDELRTELNRRTAKASPKPKSLAPCVRCQAPLSARERRKPCPHCGSRNPR